MPPAFGEAGFGCSAGLRQVSGEGGRSCCCCCLSVSLFFLRLSRKFLLCISGSALLSFRSPSLTILRSKDGLSAFPVWCTETGGPWTRSVLEKFSSVLPTTNSNVMHEQLFSLKASSFSLLFFFSFVGWGSEGWRGGREGCDIFKDSLQYLSECWTRSLLLTVVLSIPRSFRTWGKHKSYHLMGTCNHKEQGIK